MDSQTWMYLITMLVVWAMYQYMAHCERKRIKRLHVLLEESLAKGEESYAQYLQALRKVDDLAQVNAGLRRENANLRNENNSLIKRLEI